MRVSFRLSPLSPLSLLCLFTAASGAENPIQAPAASGDGTQLPIIVISPEWRPVDAQTSSKTVHSHSGEELSTAGVNDTLQLQHITPGLVFKTNAVLGQPYLRGVGSELISAGSEPSVATFADGVYLPRAYNSLAELFDVDRVEVLKGPQGVHLGRNAAGGAVSIHTQDPVPYRSGNVEARAGDYGMRQLRGAINVPLNDALAVRLAGTTTARDGYVDNIYLGKDKDDVDHYGLRVKLLYAPTSRFTAMFGSEHTAEDDSRAIAPHPDATPTSGGVAAGGTVPENPRKVTANVDANADLRVTRHNLRLQWRGDALEFTSHTAWVESETALALDLDNTDVDFSANYPSGDSEAVTQEFRLSSEPDGRPLSWTTGVFYLDERADQRLDIRLPLFGVRNVPDGRVDTRAYAVFGQLAYQWTDTWRIRAGARYNHDERTVDLVQTLTDPLGVVGPPGTIVARQHERRDWNATTPEFGLEYAPSDHRLYYVTASRGYKAGGYNTSAIQPAFDPEYLWSYEIGAKTSFPQHSLRANVALFHYAFDDMQLDSLPVGAPTGSYPVVVNAAQATIQGVDIEVLFRATAALDLSLGATSLLTAQFDDFTTVDPNNPAGDPDRSGGRLPQAPRLSLNLGADYRQHVDGGRLTFGVRYRYQSMVYYNLYQDANVSQDGYSLVDAGVTFEPARGDWYAEVYGRNLTDKLYAENVLRSDPLWGTLRFWGPPRTLGMRVGYRW